MDSLLLSFYEQHTRETGKGYLDSTKALSKIRPYFLESITFVYYWPAYYVENEEKSGMSGGTISYYYYG